MKYYSDFSKQYVQDICSSLNEAGFRMPKHSSEGSEYDPQSFRSLTDFIQKYVVMPMNVYAYLDDQGLVNRGQCPYTGERIDSSFPKWTYMGTRKIVVSHKGYEIMQKEDREDYIKQFGHPPPEPRKACYIATLCYGDENAPEVNDLRQYRDLKLSNYFIGRLMIKFYYVISPRVSQLLMGQERINMMIRRKLLDRIVSKIRRS